MKKILIFIGFLLIFGTYESFAQCACVPKLKDITPKMEFDNADIVFVGKVIEIKRTEKDKKNGSYQETVKFEISKVWKKESPKIITVVNYIQGCTNGFEVEKEWLIYAYKRTDGTFGNGCCCSRTKSLQKASEDLKEFRKSEKEMKILEDSEQ